MKSKTTKTCAILALISCFIICVCGLFMQQAKAATTQQSKISIVGASVKLMSDENDSGLRFTYQIEKTYFNETLINGETSSFKDNVSVGVVLCPTVLLPSEFNSENALDYVTSANPAVENHQIPASKWVENGDVMESYAYVYGVPAQYYDVNLTAVGYINENGAKQYTAACERSMAYVANEAIKDEAYADENELAILQKYLPTYTVTFGGDGVSVPSQNVKYGGKVDQTLVSEPTKDGYLFKGWKADGKAFDLTTEIKSNVTLTADFEKAITLASVDKPVAAGTEITLDLASLGIVIADGAQVADTTFTVTKTAGTGTVYDQAVEGNFTVEAGYIYDVNVTVELSNGYAENLYIMIYDNKLVVIGNASGDQLKIHGLTNETVNTNGNLSFKVNNETGANKSQPIVQINGSTVDDTITKYDVYATIKHGNIGAGWLLQTPEAYITADGRYTFGSTTGVSGGYHEYKITVFRSVATDNVVTFDNVVLVPKMIDLPSATNVAKAAGTTVTLNGDGLGYTLYNGLSEDDISFVVTKTKGVSYTTSGLSSSDANVREPGMLLKETVPDTSFIVESGYYYEIYLTAILQNGDTVKKYFFIYDSTLTIYNFDGVGQTFGFTGTTAAKAEKIVDEFGNVQYKIYYTATSGNSGAIRFKMDGLASSLGSSNKMYFDAISVPNSFYVGETSTTASRINLTDGAKSYNIRKTARYYNGLVSGLSVLCSGNIYLFPMNGTDSYVIIDNIVIAP